MFFLFDIWTKNQSFLYEFAYDSKNNRKTILNDKLFDRDKAFYTPIKMSITTKNQSLAAIRIPIVTNSGIR